jgi:DNA-binding GntR family transcriptional regulator
VGDAHSVRASAAEHRGIYEALLAGDGQAAADLLRQQKRRAGAWLLEHMDEEESETWSRPRRRRGSSS